MWQSYFTIAWRTLRRDGRYAALNVAGVMIGIAVTLVIALFIHHKLSFDRFHEDADRIYRIIQRDHPIIEADVARVPRGLPGRIARDVPEVEHATALSNYDRELITARGTPFFVENVLGADDHFFDVFSFELVRGSAEQALSQPGQIVLTASTARRLFGESDPMGRTVTSGGSTYRVSGIAADPPAASHFQFNALFSLSNVARERRFENAVVWGRVDYYLYVKTVEGTSPDAFQSKLDAMAEASNLRRSLVAQPLTRIHLHSDVSWRSRLAPQSDVRYLYVFGAVGLLILGVAVVNYINLSTARALRRVREVGVRKALGATRTQLVRQFLGESVLTVALALPLATALAYAALPLVNQMTGLQLALSFGQHGLFLGGAAMGTLALGLAAGSYPAFILSAFAPSSVLGGRAPMAGRRSWLQDGLVVIQFAVAAGLLLATMVVQNQLRFVQNQQLGPEEHIITFRGRDLGDQYMAFKQELDRQPHVASASIGSPPGIGWASSGVVFNDDSKETRQDIVAVTGDSDYLETVGLRLLAGRAFPPGATKASAYGFYSEYGALVNETFAREYGVGPEDVGSEVETAGAGFGGPDILVRGIVEDFHNQSLREPIPPLLIVPPAGPEARYDRAFVVRLEEDKTVAGLDEVRAVWDAFVPSRPLDYQFLDNRIEAQYAASQRLMHVFGLFAGIALFVTALGLLGLTAYMAERRTKEVGIRKAIGATAASIVWLFSKDTARLVGIGVVVGLPLAYLGAQQWLQQFAYQAEIGAGLIAGAIVMVLLIALGAASVQSLRAARIDPAETLRYE